METQASRTQLLWVMRALAKEPVTTSKRHQPHFPPQGQDAVLLHGHGAITAPAAGAAPVTIPPPEPDGCPERIPAMGSEGGGPCCVPLVVYPPRPHGPPPLPGAAPSAARLASSRPVLPPVGESRRAGAAGAERSGAERLGPGSAEPWSRRSSSGCWGCCCCSATVRTGGGAQGSGGARGWVRGEARGAGQQRGC